MMRERPILFSAAMGHHGIGSLTDCEIGDWLRLRPLQPNAKVSGAGTASAGLPG